MSTALLLGHNNWKGQYEVNPESWRLRGRFPVHIIHVRKVFPVFAITAITKIGN